MTTSAADAAAFPVLQPELIQEMVSCAAPVRRTFKKGDQLYQAGDRDFGFFVIVSGKVDSRGRRRIQVDHDVRARPVHRRCRATDRRSLAGDGSGRRRHRSVRDRTIDTTALFSFIGAEPRTNWLPEEIEKDERGFVRSGLSVTKKFDHGLTRDRFLLETSCPGVFAAGDVRSGSVKRVASAVGEGAMAVQVVHEFLKAR